MSYLFEGEILHRDSLGTVQAIRPGKVNRMTAGRGIAHSERTAPGVRQVGFRGVDRSVYERGRDVPARRHKVAGRGTKWFDCGHQGEVTVTTLRLKRDPGAFVKRLGRGLRCTRCYHRGAAVDARHALGHFG